METFDHLLACRVLPIPRMGNKDMSSGNPWDDHADAYADWVERRERPLGAALAQGAIPAALLALLGNVRGKAVLDAGCGEGFLARILAARGARVTGIDLGPRLIARARERGPADITYRIADLSRPLPDLAGAFDAVGSYLVLNDVADLRGFAGGLAVLTRPGGRAALALNNPYSSVLRGHLNDYFAEGARPLYGGMSAALGGPVAYYHRTLGEYLAAFLDAGWCLAALVDVSAPARDDLPLPPGSRFPFFTVLAFDKVPQGAD